MLLPDASSYAQAYERFAWQVPDRLNLGAQIVDEPARRSADKVAIRNAISGESITFGELADEAGRLTRALGTLGLKRGDRVAVIGAQTARLVAVHAAILRAGLISVPLSERYGPGALEHRLVDSGARAVFSSNDGVENLSRMKRWPPELELLVTLDEVQGPSGTQLPTATSYSELISTAHSVQPAVDTSADDPAMMIYTSGTTGPAKGALHAHRVLAGHMPGFLFAHGSEIGEEAVFYTPADWAWAGGLYNLLFPALSLGRTVVAHPRKTGFNPAVEVDMMRAEGVTHGFLPPTACKMIRAGTASGAFGSVGLRSVMAAGEALGRDTFAWAQSELGFPISEAYGQTECNLVLGTSPTYGVVAAGATGVPVPGHKVALLRQDGSEANVGEPGEIAIAAPDPVMFLGYWNQPNASARKVVDGWLMTGDIAFRDAEGFFRFIGRDDDIITSAGHRVGPTEIEDCLSSHPSVAMAGVVGVPDELRTEIIRAFVVLREGVEPSDALAEALGRHVRQQLAAHEYPRDIQFVDALPMTTTGKIIRRLLKEPRDAA